MQAISSLRWIAIHRSDAHKFEAETVPGGRPPVHAELKTSLQQLAGLRTCRTVANSFAVMRPFLLAYTLKAPIWISWSTLQRPTDPVDAQRTTADC